MTLISRRIERLEERFAVDQPETISNEELAALQAEVRREHLGLGSRSHRDAAPQRRQCDLHRRVSVAGRSAGGRRTRHHATRVYSR
jgi:hypothetical protein